MKQVVDLKVPAGEAALKNLKTGDQVLISGVIYVARDAAHRRIIETLEQGNPAPFPLTGQTIYYMGPSPPKPGRVIGSAGPTTSGRMDAYAPTLLSKGLRVMIGKGERSESVKKAIKKYGAVYLAAIGGAGAMISKSIKKCDVVAYPELGAEAVLRLEVENFPAVVVNDVHGGDLYEEGKARYRRTVH